MKIIRVSQYACAIGLLLLSSCREVLAPEPVNQLTNELVLSSPADVETVRIGLYNALRGSASLKVVAGDLTADMAIHNGTFNEYREFSNKQITPSNDAVAQLWGALYGIVYRSNFVLERLPELGGVPTQQRKSVLAEAHLLRGYAYFTLAFTYGDVPLVTTTNVEANRNVARQPREAILAQAEEDLLKALPDLPDKPVNAGFAGKNTAKAMLARYYLYIRNWINAEKYATEVINSGLYTLDPDFLDVVGKDFAAESILEVAYTNTDDPGTNTYSLNNIFVGRREVIPSNQAASALLSSESGARRRTLSFDPAQQRGSDNGFTVRKYGTNDEDNNNIVIFRLGEMYLIRAEARARQNRVTGTDGAEADINVLRKRAQAPVVAGSNATSIFPVIEQERIYELAFEGHRWYDLVRTERAQPIMLAFSPNWDSKYELWPVPLREIQNNPALRGNQNPGY